MEIKVNDLLSLSEKQIDDAEKVINIAADRFFIHKDFMEFQRTLDNDLKSILGLFYEKYLDKLDYIAPNKSGKMILRIILHKARMAKLLYKTE